MQSQTSCKHTLLKVGCWFACLDVTPCSGFHGNINVKAGIPWMHLPSPPFSHPQNHHMK